MPELPKSIFFIPLVMVLGTAAYASGVPANSGTTRDAGTTDSSRQSGSAPVSDNVTPEQQELRNSVTQYLRNIKRLQKTHGAFYDQIGENLIGLGLLYRNLGQNKQAVQAFNQALHINRINHGLYGASQLPIMELIIQTNTALSDWQALDQNFYYLYWVDRRLYGDNDPRLLPVIERLGRWHLQACSLMVDSVPSKHLLKAADLFQNAIRIIEQNYGSHDQRLLKPLLGLAITDYRIAQHVSMVETYEEQDFGIGFPGDQEQEMEEVRNQQVLFFNSYRDGQKALSRIISVYETNPNLSKRDYGRALVFLGDWYLLFDRRTSASKTYAMAYAKLQDSGMDNKDINRLFAKPRSLPDFQFSTENRPPDDSGNYIIAKFDVSKNGRARNIEIVKTSVADNDTLRRRAKDSIRTARFRPRLENGQPVATTGVNVKFIISND